MTGWAKDPRRPALVHALLPLLEDSCPPDGHGYGGAFELRLPDEEVVGLGGVELLRSALRAAARELGWRVESFAWAGTIHGTMAGVRDLREPPPGTAAAVEAHWERRLQAAVELGRRSRPADAPLPPGATDWAALAAAFRTAHARALDATGPTAPRTPQG
ncbi:hypothetical protein ACFVIM_27415 [Streptomyces sp. NPDC057638]|uniref:hypothetical protein n=1 Tax=Streptomyces sp. NPDC057638 TaxID=3346190 RepID=UPI00367F71FB